MGNHKEFTPWTGTGQLSHLHEWERRDERLLLMKS